MKLIKLVLVLIVAFWAVFTIAASALGAAEIAAHFTKSRTIQFALIAWSVSVSVGGVLTGITWFRRIVLRTSSALVLPGLVLIPTVAVFGFAALVTSMIP